MRARRTGDARSALDVLAQHGGLDGEEAIREACAILILELGTGDLAPLPDHPDRNRIQAALEGAEKTREELKTSPLDWEPEGLAVYLDDLFADRLVENAVHQFFGLASAFGGIFEGRPIDVEAIQLSMPGEGPLGASETHPAELAERFAAAARPRASLRWQIRAWRDEPGTPEVTLPLLDALVERNELHAALRVALASASAAPASFGPELSATTANIATWCNDRRVEIGGLERMVELGVARIGDRSRLAEIYVFGGQIEEARPHAEFLAEVDSRNEIQVLPIALALQSGDVETALRRVRRLADLESPPGHWTHYELDLLREDLRYDAIEARLKELARRHPETFREPYRAVLERRWRLGPLAELAFEDATQSPGDKERMHTAFALAASENRRDLLLGLLRLELTTGWDPGTVLLHVEALENRGIGSRARAELMTALRKRELTHEETLSAFNALRSVSWDEATFREVARAGRAHSGHPAVQLAMIGAVEQHVPERALGLFGAIAAKGTPSPAVARGWLDRARSSDDPKAEVSALGWLLRHEPNSVQYRGEFAEALGRSGDAARAYRAWDGVIAGSSAGIGPKWLASWMRSAFATDHQGRAEDIYREHVAHRSDAAAILRLVMESTDPTREPLAAERTWTHLLEHDPHDPAALLGLAEFRMEARRSSEALDLLRRASDTPEGLDVRGHFMAAEISQSLADPESVRFHARSILDAVDPGTRDRDARVSRALAIGMLGRADESLRLLTGLHKEAPGDDAIGLQLAEALFAAGSIENARERVQRALDSDPTNVRGLRLLAQIYQSTEDRQESLSALRAAASLTPEEAAPIVELVTAYDEAGRWVDARRTATSARASIPPGPGALQLQAAEQDLMERTADLLGAQISFQAVADDSTFITGIFGSTLVGSEWTRLLASVESARYIGRANAVAAGRTDIEESVTSFRLVLDQRHAAERAWAVGAHLFPGAPGGGSAGLFGAYHWEEDRSPSWQARVALHIADLWTQPAAAVGLGGRTSGLTGEGFLALDERWWTSATLIVEDLSLDSAPTGDVSETRMTARAALGRVLTENRPRVADRTQFDRARPLGFSPFLEDDGTDRDHLQVYAGIDHQSMSGGDLAALVPIAEEASYVLIGGRADRLLQRGLGAMAEAVAGVDIAAGDPAVSLDLGLTYRPTFGIECTAKAGVGRALGRGSADTETRLLLGVQLRR